MKSLVLGAIAGLVFVGVASFWTSSDVKADNGPHMANQSMTTDACAGCHRAHTAQGAYLLKVDEQQLCLTCHDGSAANTNVLDGVQLSVQGPRDGDPSDGNDAQTVNGALRGGGFQYARIDTQDGTWRFSVQCTESATVPSTTTVPGWPDVPCDDGDSTGGESPRITFCGSGTTVFTTPPPNNSAPVTVSNPNGGNCATPSGAADPGTWFLKIGTLAAPEATTSVHSVGVTGQTLWGSGTISGTANTGAAGVEIACVSCHNPHGNQQYRILRPEPASHLLVGTATNTFPGGVSLPDRCPNATDHSPYTTAPFTSCQAGEEYDYSTTNYINPTYVVNTTGGQLNQLSGGSPYVDGGDTTPDITAYTGISAWCAQCHSRYLARGVYATDSGDAVFRYRHSTESTPGYNGRQCNTCHAAHGTNAAMSGIAAGATVGLTEGGSALLKMDNRGICVKCHKVP